MHTRSGAREYAPMPMSVGTIGSVLVRPAMSFTNWSVLVAATQGGQAQRHDCPHM